MFYTPDECLKGNPKLAVWRKYIDDEDDRASLGSINTPESRISFFLPTPSYIKEDSSYFGLIALEMGEGGLCWGAV